MPVPRTFAQCLTSLMQERQLTASALGARIGMRADLRRVLEDEATPSRQAAVFRRLCEGAFFSEAQQQQLRDALEVSRMGIDRYLTFTSMNKLLGFAPMDAHAEPRVLGGEALSRYFETWVQSDCLDIILINGCHPALLGALATLFSDRNRPMRMDHYVQLDKPGNDPASFLLSAAPMLFDPRYTPYGVHASIANQHEITGHFLLVRAVRGDRTRQWFFLINADATAYELANAGRVDIFAFVQRILGDLTPSPLMLKEFQSGKPDYLSFLMQCLRRELNRSTYSLSSNLCLCKTPTDILLNSFYEGGVMPSQDVDKMVGKALPVFKKRYYNWFHRSKPVYDIFTSQGVDTLMETGCLCDHFFAMRPFTPAERLEILRQQLLFAQANPRYDMRMLKREYSPRFLFVCYENLCVSLVPSSVDYNLTNGYDQVTFSMPGFVRLLREYFLEVLVPRYCHTREASLDYLRQALARYGG